MPADLLSGNAPTTSALPSWQTLAGHLPSSGPSMPDACRWFRAASPALAPSEARAVLRADLRVESLPFVILHASIFSAPVPNASTFAATVPWRGLRAKHSGSSAGFRDAEKPSNSFGVCRIAGSSHVPIMFRHPMFVVRRVHLQIRCDCPTDCDLVMHFLCWIASGPTFARLSGCVPERSRSSAPLDGRAENHPVSLVRFDVAAALPRRVVRPRKFRVGAARSGAEMHAIAASP